MISVQKKFLFIHVPKTGGNSIQNVLREYSEDEIVCSEDHHDGVERFGVKNAKYDIKKHSPLSQYKQELEPDFYRQLFKFSIIRNPWDKLVSWYFSPGSGRTAWEREAFAEMLQKLPPLRHHVIVPTMTEKVSGKLGIGGKLPPLDRDVDALLSFERLNEDFKTLCEKIDIPPVDLPVRNKSSRDHYSKYYDQELKEIVAERFADEIEFGGYEFETA